MTPIGLQEQLGVVVRLLRGGLYHISLGDFRALQLTLESVFLLLLEHGHLVQRINNL
jgi:hypothetical protein